MEGAVHREWNVLKYFELLRRRRLLLIIAAVLGGATGFVLSVVLPAQYTSHTLVLVEEPVVPDTYAKPVAGEDLKHRLAHLPGQILDHRQLQELVEKFDPYKKDVARVPMETMIERLKRSIKVAALNPMPGTLSRELPGFTVDVTLGEARLAQQVCGEITSLFTNQNIRQRRQQAEDRTQLSAKQLEEAKTKLDEREAKLDAFRSLHAGALPEDEKTNGTRLADTKSQLEAVTQGLNQDRQERALDESRLNQQLALKTAASRDNTQRIEQELSDRQSQLASLQLKYTDSHPDVIKLKSEITQLQQQIQEKTTREASTVGEQKPKAAVPDTPQIRKLRAQLHQLDLNISENAKQQEDLDQEIRAIQDRMALSSSIQQEFKALTQDYQTALDLYEDLLKKRNASQTATTLESQQQAETLHMVDPPSLPEQPSFPDRRLFSLGGLSAGLILAVGMVHLLEARDKSIRTRQDVEVYLGIPTLAVIPNKGSARKIRSRTNAAVARKSGVLSLSASSWKN